MDEPVPVTDDIALDGPLLFGRVLDGTGGARRIDWAEASAWQPSAAGEVLWLHLCRNLPSASQWLSGTLGLPEPTVELLTSDATRPRAFREGDTLVATLRGINFNPGAEPEDMIAMQLWCDGRRVITLRRRPLQSPRDVLAEVDAGRGPTDAGGLICDLTEVMIGRMNRSIVDMNGEIDRMEDADQESDTEQLLARIATIRRNCLALKRYMAPQHDALESIARDAPEWFEDHDRREISESIDRLRRYLDDLDISKESALVLQDDFRVRTAARSERTTFLLTIVAAVFLPLGFLTGLLGINVGGIPGVDDSNAFWVVCGLCGVVFLMQIVLFWRWKWL
jgi:zinc transporter